MSVVYYLPVAPDRCWYTTVHADQSEPPPHVFECAQSSCDLAVMNLLQRAYQVAERAVSMASAADREDAIQSTWIKVWEKLVADSGDDASFTGEGSFDSWVRAIAVNSARGIIRHQGRKSAPVLGIGSAAEPSGRFTSAHVNNLQAAAAITRLPEDEYDFYVLREVVGLTSTQISELKDVSLATTKRRIRSARARVHRNVTLADPDHPSPKAP